MAKKSTKRYVALAEYDGGAVYEPAEGGYYVEVSRLANVYPLCYKHARRKLRQIAAEYKRDGYEVAEYSDGIVIRFSAYVGDFVKFKITRTPEKHEQHYHGYC